MGVPGFFHSACVGGNDSAKLIVRLEIFPSLSHGVLCGVKSAPLWRELWCVPERSFRGT